MPLKDACVDHSWLGVLGAGLPFFAANHAEGRNRGAFVWSHFLTLALITPSSAYLEQNSAFLLPMTVARVYFCPCCGDSRLV